LGDCAKIIAVVCWGEQSDANQAEIAEREATGFRVVVGSTAQGRRKSLP